MRSALLLLVACQTTPGGKGPAPTDDTGVGVDSAAPDDTGGDPRPDDTGSPTPIVVTGVVSAGDLPDGLQVSLVPALFGLGPELLAPLATTTPDPTGAFAFSLPPEPPNGHKYEVGEFQPLDVFGTTYLVIASIDADGDGFTAGDPILGVALDGLVVWTDATAAEKGWPTGWSVVDTGLSGTYGSGRCFSDTDLPLQWRREAPYPVFAAVDDAPVTVPLLGQPRALSLSASVSGVPEGSDRMGLLDYREVFQGIPGLDLATDDARPATTWDVDLTTAPDPSADLVSNATQAYALYVPLAYADVDASGGWTVGDTPDGSTLCSEAGDRLLVRYTREPTSWQGYKLLDCRAGTAGWRVVSRASDGNWSVYLDDAAVAAAAVDPSRCSWGER
jgi:hypothetical protein